MDQATFLAVAGSDAPSSPGQNIVVLAPDQDVVAATAAELVVPHLVADAGDAAAKRFLEFFAVTIRNPDTRAAYVRACQQYFAWCDHTSVGQLVDVEPINVAAYVEGLTTIPGLPSLDASHPSQNRCDATKYVENGQGGRPVVERIRDLLDRFPEDEQAVKALIAADEEFNSLCQEYGEIMKELSSMKEQGPLGPEADIAGLVKRRNAVEAALLSKMEGYEPL